MTILYIKTYSLTSKTNEFLSEPPYKYIIQTDAYPAVLFSISYWESTVKTTKLCPILL